MIDENGLGKNLSCEEVWIIPRTMVSNSELELWLVQEGLAFGCSLMGVVFIKSRSDEKREVQFDPGPQ